MARNKFDGNAYHYALCKKEAVDRFIDKKPLFPDVEIELAREVLRDIREDKNPYHPLPKGYTREDLTKAMMPAEKIFLRLCNGERKSAVCFDAGKANSSALDEWLVNTISGFRGVHRHAEDDDESTRRLAAEMGIPPIRTNAQIVKLMLTKVQRARENPLQPFIDFKESLQKQKD